MSHYKNSKQLDELQAAEAKAAEAAAEAEAAAAAEAATEPEKQAAAAAAAAAARATNEHTKAKKASTVVNDILPKYLEKLKDYIKAST